MPIEYTIVIVCFKTVLDKLLGRLSRQHNIKIKTRKGAERTVFEICTCHYHFCHDFVFAKSKYWPFPSSSLPSRHLVEVVGAQNNRHMNGRLLKRQYITTDFFTKHLISGKMGHSPFAHLPKYTLFATQNFELALTLRRNPLGN